MLLKFTKMHGISNDYIYFNCFEGIPFDPEKLSVAMSPRRSSVGSDGIVLVCRSDKADCRMRIFNADGSEAKMCGNGIRCVGKFAYDNGLVDKTEIDVETESGIKHLSMQLENGRVKTVSVEMGYVSFAPADVPVVYPEECVSKPFKAAGRVWNITALSVGNPHCVTFVDDVDTLDLEKIGPEFEFSSLFPDRVNTEFIQVIDRKTLKMRVWERGSGETWACGTGASASVAAAVKNGLCDPDTPVTVHLRGGDLTITYRTDGSILMNGGAETVYNGEYEYEDQHK